MLYLNVQFVQISHNNYLKNYSKDYIKKNIHDFVIKIKYKFCVLNYCDKFIYGTL